MLWVNLKLFVCVNHGNNISEISRGVQLQQINGKLIKFTTVYPYKLTFNKGFIILGELLGNLIFKFLKKLTYNKNKII